MRIEYVAPLSRAWDRMIRILFTPFDLVKWLVLGFSAWLAGLAGGGGSKWLGTEQEDFPSRHEVFRDFGDAFEHLLERAFLAPLILFAMLLVLGIILVLLWLSSRGKFIFLDNLVHDRSLITDPWNRFRSLGNSLFLWRVGFMLVSGAVIVLILVMLIAGPAIGLAWNSALRGLTIVSAIIGGVLIFLFVVAVVYVTLFLESFVIPIMYKYDLKATEAWRYFTPWLSARTGAFVTYGLYVLCLWVLFAVAFSVFCILTCCISLLPYIGTVLLLPVIVTYRLLSVEFLAQFDPGFDLFTSIEAGAQVEVAGELE